MKNAVLEPSNNNNKTIIFDCDGVLVDSEPLSVRAYDIVFEQDGIPLPQGALAQCFGLKQEAILDKFAKLYGKRLSSEGESKLWPETKKLFDKELKATIGIQGFLQKQTDKMAVASSSSSERLLYSLEKTHLAVFFGKHIYSTSLVKNGKPAPDIFLYVAERLNAQPQNCVVIEDSPYGIMGAKAAGMMAIGYLGGGHIKLMTDHDKVLQQAGADFIADDWDEVGAFLAHCV